MDEEGSGEVSHGYSRDLLDICPRCRADWLYGCMHAQNISHFDGHEMLFRYATSKFQSESEGQYLHVSKYLNFCYVNW